MKPTKKKTDPKTPRAPVATGTFEAWLREHMRQAVVRYEELCVLDDQVVETGGETSEYYEQSHQMFGYVAALEKCLKEVTGDKPKRAPKARS